jgi:hypothetical protein
VNFLSFIAESGVFDRANRKNKIENARLAKLWDVLIYASEKKGYEVGMNAYYKRQSERK